MSETTEDQDVTPDVSPDDDQGTKQDAAAEDQDTEGTDQAEADQDAEDDTADPVKAARREAGKFRRRLRETEAERDALAERLEALRWGMVKSALQGMKTVEPLRAAGHTIEEFLDADGAINTVTVQKIERRFAEETGLSLRQPSDSWSQDAGNRGPSAPAELSWADALSPRKR